MEGWSDLDISRGRGGLTQISRKSACLTQISRGRDGLS